MVPFFVRVATLGAALTASACGPGDTQSAAPQGQGGQTPQLGATAGQAGAMADPAPISHGGTGGTSDGAAAGGAVSAGGTLANDDATAGGSGGSTADGGGGGQAEEEMMFPDTEGYVFYIDNCDACHEFMGQGKPKDQGGPDIAHPDREFARWVIRNGRMRPDYEQDMRAHPPEELPDEVLEELLDYLEGVPKPETPEGLYLDYCVNCHGEDAQGGMSMSDISMADEATFLESCRSGHNLDMLAERELFMPRFTPEQLSDEEIAAIHAYVSGL